MQGENSQPGPMPAVLGALYSSLPLLSWESPILQRIRENAAKAGYVPPRGVDTTFPLLWEGDNS